MKEDYLWDKKGSDSEIEKLENSLKAFRSKNTIPPELPANNFVFEKKTEQSNSTQRFTFRFTFAAFAVLVLIVFSVGIFQTLSTEEQNLAQNTSEKMSDEVKSEKSKVTLSQTFEAKEPAKELVKTQEIQPKIKKAKWIPKPKAKTKVKKQIRSKVIDKQIIAKNVLPKPKKIAPEVQVVKLTKEEKDAYDQVMRALAITSSQMKIVQEKINGEEESTLR